MERQPGQLLERHDMAEDSTRQGNLQTADDDDDDDDNDDIYNVGGPLR